MNRPTLIAAGVVLAVAAMLLAALFSIPPAWSSTTPAGERRSPPARDSLAVFGLTWICAGSAAARGVVRCWIVPTIPTARAPPR